MAKQPGNFATEHLQEILQSSLSCWLLHLPSYSIVVSLFRLRTWRGRISISDTAAGACTLSCDGAVASSMCFLIISLAQHDS